MTQSPEIRRLFAFDTEFDADGSVVRASAWKPAKRSYLPAEVDALVAQGRLEAVSYTHLTLPTTPYV